jgi:hypothetical protein
LWDNEVTNMFRAGYILEHEIKKQLRLLR